MPNQKTAQTLAIEALEAVANWLVRFSECETDEIAADGGVTVGMVCQQEALWQSARVDNAIAALRAPVAGVGEEVTVDYTDGIEPWQHDAAYNLSLLYNHKHDDSVQFTRQQMLVAIEFGVHKYSAEVETYRQMHDIATIDLGYPSMLEALEATPPATPLPAADGPATGEAIDFEAIDAVIAEMIEVAVNDGEDEGWLIDFDRGDVDRWQAKLQIATGHEDGFPSRKATTKPSNPPPCDDQQTESAGEGK